MDDTVKIAHMQFMEQLDSPLEKWKLIDQSKVASFYKRDWVNATTLFLRAEIMLPGVCPDHAFDVLTNLRLRKQWDKRLQSVDIIEETEVTVKSYIKLAKVNIPFVAQRDQLVQQHRMMNYPREGTHFSV
jgi:hypothetical protein